jgi:hypothetical protein
MLAFAMQGNANPNGYLILSKNVVNELIQPPDGAYKNDSIEIRNIDDSLITIENISLIADTTKFPIYEIKWYTENGSFYEYGNYACPLVIFYQRRPISISALSKNIFSDFMIDCHVCFPTLQKRQIKNAESMTMKLVLYSRNRQNSLPLVADTITINGTATTCDISTIGFKSGKRHRIFSGESSKSIYDIYGRRIDNIRNKYLRNGTGIIIDQNGMKSVNLNDTKGSK